MAERAGRLGYWVKSLITWEKTGSMPETASSRVARELEYVIHPAVDRAPLFRKDAWQHLAGELGGRNPRYESAKLSDVWTFQPRRAEAATERSSPARFLAAASP